MISVYDWLKMRRSTIRFRNIQSKKCIKVARKGRSQIETICTLKKVICIMKHTPRLLLGSTLRCAKNNTFYYSTFWKLCSIFSVLFCLSLKMTTTRVIETSFNIITKNPQDSIQTWTIHNHKHASKTIHRI